MNRTALLLLATVVVVGGAWLLFSGEEGGRPAAPPSDGPMPAREAGPTLESGTLAPPDPGEASPEKPEEPASPADGGPLEAAPPLRLEGRFVGWDRSLPGEVVLEVKRVDGEEPATAWRIPSELALSEEFGFSVDLSSVLPKGEREGELQVVADHPAYVRHVARVHSGEGREGRLFLEIPLRRAGVIRGRVEDEAGEPAAGADVGVFVLSDGRPERQAVDAAKCDDSGRYRLRVGAKGRFLVGARMPGREPAATEVELATGASADLETLVLRDGLAIQGTVRYRGEPLAGAVIDLGTKEDEELLSLGEGRALWHDGRLHHRYLQVTTEPDGRYSFRGLTPITYRMVVSGGEGLLLHFDDARDGGREVRAPARDVDFDVAALRLVAEFQCDGKPLPGLAVWLNTLVEQEGLPEGSFGVFGYHPTVTDDAGRVTVHVTPGKRYVFGIIGDAYEHYTDHFVTPKTGVEHRRVIEVKRKPDMPKLEVTLVGPGAKKLKRASFGFYTPGKGPGQRSAYPICSVNCEGGRCLLENLRPGRWLMIARPGRDWHESFSHYLESRVEVDLPRAGTAEVRVPIRVGGALRITVRDASGRMLGPQCKVVDDQGEDVVVTFSIRSGNHITVSTSRMLASVPNRVLQALAPGTYELRFTHDGFLPKTVETRIEERRTTNVETVLEAIR